MRVLMAHNRYLERGGEDNSTRAEADLLRAHGCAVTLYQRSNEDVAALGAWRTGLKSLWNQETYRAVRRLLAGGGFDVVHVQNFFPLISPAIYYAARDARVPVVQSIRNYRLTCPGAFLMREGRVCEDCLGRAVAWPGVLHRCYRGSLGASAAVAGMTALHRFAGTWSGRVDRYIALTRFARAKLIEAGLPGGKIAVKPNFVAPDPGRGEHRRSHFLYVGRLSAEKGLDVLIDAWRQTGIEGTLLIAGTGPLEDHLKRRSSDLETVRFLGALPIGEIYGLMRRARALVFPSLWYEGMPRTIIEAFATATPVISSRLGSMGEMIEDRETGLFFEPGDGAGLARALVWAEESRRAMAAMGDNARREFETTYSGEANIGQLLAIYREAGAQSLRSCGPVNAAANRPRGATIS